MKRTRFLGGLAAVALAAPALARAAATTYAVHHSDADWQKLLGPDRYVILRENGTEPSCGPYLSHDVPIGSNPRGLIRSRPKSLSRTPRRAPLGPTPAAVPRRKGPASERAEFKSPSGETVSAGGDSAGRGHVSRSAITAAVYGLCAGFSALLLVVCVLPCFPP